MAELRQWMQMADSLHEVATLLEAFSQPLPLRYSQERTQAIQALYPAVSAVSVYAAELSGTEIEFIEFLFKGAWEVHFNNRSADHRVDDEIVGTVLKDFGMTKVVATALSMLEKRFRDGRPIRYYAQNERLRRLYDKVFAFLNTGEFAANIMRFETESFRAPSGVVLPAVVLELDTRTLPLPSPRVDEGLRLMHQASVAALRG